MPAACTTVSLAELGNAHCANASSAPRAPPAARIAVNAELLARMLCGLDLEPPVELLALLLQLAGADANDYAQLYMPQAHICTDDCNLVFVAGESSESDDSVCPLYAVSEIRIRREQRMLNTLDEARAAPKLPSLGSVSAALAELLRACSGFVYERPADDRDLLSLRWLLVFFGLRLTRSAAIELFVWAARACQQRSAANFYHGLICALDEADDADVDRRTAALAESARIAVCSLAGTTDLGDADESDMAPYERAPMKTNQLCSLAARLSKAPPTSAMLPCAALTHTLALNASELPVDTFDELLMCFTAAICALAQAPAESTDAPPAKRQCIQ